MSRDDSDEQELNKLRELVIRLQRDVTRQEGEILDMKRTIASCMTKEQASERFATLSTPRHVEKKFDAIKNQLMVEVDSKANKSDLQTALRKKASAADLMQLNRDLESLLDYIRKHTASGAALHLMSPIDAAAPSQLTATNAIDSSQLDLMAEQLTVLESAFDDFVSGVEPKSLKRPTSSKSHMSGPIRQIHELTDYISTFESISNDLDAKYKVMSDWATVYPEKVAECVKLTANAQQSLGAIEQTIRASAMDPERVYLDVHPKVQEICKHMANALEFMQEETTSNQMLNACNITHELDKLRADLSEVKVSLHEQISSISEILARLNKEDCTHGRRLAIWQEGIMNTLNSVKSLAESNQNELKEFEHPILDQINILQSENRMFFKELLRIEGQFEELVYEIKKASHRKLCSQSNATIKAKSKL